jgi:hypothetical protein
LNKLDQVPTKIQIVDSNGIPTNALVMFLVKLVAKINTIAHTLASNRNLVSVSINYTVPTGNYSVIVDATSGAITITLPLASTDTSYIVGVTKKDVSANSVTIVRSGTDLICGSVSQTLLYQNEVLNFISDGANWQLAN